MTDPPEWLNPPAELHMERAELHIWRATDQDVSAAFKALLPLLNREEQARAAGFKFDRDRTRFIFCRGALRQLLGRYTGKPPGEIAFTYGPFGKPSLAGKSSGSGSPPLQFNVSHTPGLALFAFSPTLPVGIDVEAIDPAHDWQPTARHFFHPDEWAKLESFPPAARAREGYRIWTCKEACLKALGEGVGGGLETFEVILPTSSSDEIRIALPTDSQASGAWLRTIEVGKGFAAAVATLGRPGPVHAWNWKRG